MEQPPATTRWRKWTAVRGTWPRPWITSTAACATTAITSAPATCEAVVLGKLDRQAEAERAVRDTLALDPLDWWARWLAGQPMTCDVQVLLDLAHDYIRAGLYPEAIALLGRAETAARTEGGPAGASSLPTQSWGAAPLVDYTLGWLQQRLGDADRRRQCAAGRPRGRPTIASLRGWRKSPSWRPPIRADPDDARAPYYLGNLLYDRRRHEEAMVMWQRSRPARSAQRGRLAEPGHRLLQPSPPAGQGPGGLRKGLPRRPRRRPAPLRARPALEATGRTRRPSGCANWKNAAGLVDRRDDLTVELCALYNQTGRHQQALALLSRQEVSALGGRRGTGAGAVRAQPLGAGPLCAGCRAPLARGPGAFSGGGRPAAEPRRGAAPAGQPERRAVLARLRPARRWAISPMPASIGWRRPTPRATSRR